MHRWIKAYRDVYTEDEKRQLYELEEQMAQSNALVFKMSWRNKLRLAQAMARPMRERMGY